MAENALTNAYETYTIVQAEMMRRELREFTRGAWPIVEPGAPFTPGKHLDAICDHLTYVSLGDIDDLVINIPPRHTKSITVAVMWPAWEWTWNPSNQWLFATYALDLTIRDSVKCRRLIQSPWYQERYGSVFQLSGDLNQKKRFDNDKNGYRLATAVKGQATGEGGDKIVIDDAHNMNEVNSDTIRQSVIDWWRNTMSTRGNNPKRLGRVIIAQRGHHMDLPGYALSTGRFVHLNLPGYFRTKTRCVTKAKKLGRRRDLKTQPPAHNPRFRKPLEVDEEIFRDWRTQEDELLCPERFDQDAMDRLADELTERAFEAQIQQNPSAKGGNILKEEHWRVWEDVELPRCQMVIQSYDTAFEEDEEDDFSARTTWGVFEWEEQAFEGLPWQLRYNNQPRLSLILLEHMEERLTFPDLREEAQRSAEQWEPDRILIEKKSSGHSLIQELRRGLRAKGTSVTAVKVSDSKFARAHAASLVLERGCVWIPKRRWAYGVRKHCGEFPTGENDDTFDTVTQALLWLRTRWNAEYTDEEDPAEINLMKAIQGRKIYG